MRTLSLPVSLLMLASVGAGCATAESSRPAARAMSSGEMNAGYKEAVDSSTMHLAEQGYGDPTLETVTEQTPNLFRLRFGVTREGGRRTVEVKFDTNQHRTLGSEEVNPLEPKPPTSK